MGFIPSRAATEQTPDWRKLSMLGYPFRHPPLRVRPLPSPLWPPAAAVERGCSSPAAPTAPTGISEGDDVRASGEGARVSLVHVPRVECECSLWTDWAAHAQQCPRIYS